MEIFLDIFQKDDIIYDMEYIGKNEIDLIALRADIEQLRSHGLHQSLARMLNISNATFTRKLNGTRRWSQRELNILCLTLGKTIREYLKGDIHGCI